jgi:hypothetical protein
MNDERDGWMRGRSWWDEQLRDIKMSASRIAGDADLQLRDSYKKDNIKRKGSNGPSRPTSPGSRTRQPVRQVGAWDAEQVQRDSKAWSEMLESSRQLRQDDDSSAPCTKTGSTEKQHVRAVLKTLHASWLAIRKVLVTQARASNVEPITDYSIGFDEFSCAVELAGISVTRMQLDAVFNLIDADKCAIITLEELLAFFRREGFRVSSFSSKGSSSRETEKVRKSLSEIFDHVVEVMVCWDLHGNNSTTLIDIGRGLRYLKIPGIDVNKVIAEASADCTFIDGALHLKEFLRQFTWHALEPLPELVAKYECTKLQRAIVMGKVRAWKARQEATHIDPDLLVVCSRLRRKWGTISSMFSAVRATGFERRSSGTHDKGAQRNIKLDEWKAGIEACGLQLTHKQIERVYHLVEKGDAGAGVSLHDLEEAMRLTGELTHGAAHAQRAAASYGDRGTSAPAKVVPGTQFACLTVHKYKYWPRSWYKSTNNDAAAVSRPGVSEGARAVRGDMGLACRGEHH